MTNSTRKLLEERASERVNGTSFGNYLKNKTKKNKTKQKRSKTDDKKRDTVDHLNDSVKLKSIQQKTCCCSPPCFSCIPYTCIHTRDMYPVQSVLYFIQRCELMNALHCTVHTFKSSQTHSIVFQCNFAFDRVFCCCCCC